MAVTYCRAYHVMSYALGLNDATHICIYKDKSLRQEPSRLYRLTLDYSLGGPLRTHRVGFSFSGGVKCSIDFPSPSSDVLEKETLD
jgi:hypothetical protein